MNTYRTRDDRLWTIAYVVQFEIETASVTHWFSVVVSSPQSRRICRAVGAGHSGAFVPRLLDKKIYQTIIIDDKVTIIIIDFIVA